MKWKTTLVLFLLVLALGAFFVIYTSREPGAEEFALEQKRVFSHADFPNSADPASEGVEHMLTRIVLEKDAAKVVLERDDARSQQWRIVEPVQAPADHFAVQDMLRQLGQAEFSASVPAEQGKPLDLKTFGLESPKAGLTLTGPGKSVSLALGGATADGKSRYASRHDKPGVVWVVPSRLEDLAAKSAADLRDKSLFHVDRALATNLTMSEGANRVVLKQTGGRWRIVEPVDDDVTAETVERLLSTLDELRLKTEDYIAEQESPEYGFASPWLMIALESGGRKPQTLTVGAEAKDAQGRRYARLNNQSSIFALAQSDLDRVERSPERLRRWNAIAFAPGDVTEFEIRAAGAATRVTRKEGGWKFDGAQGEPDADAVNALLNGINALEIRSRVEQPTPDAIETTGLKEPSIVVTLKFKEGQAAELNFGKPLEADPGQVWARRGNEGPLLAVPGGVVARLAGGSLAVVGRSVMQFDRSAVDGARIERPDGAVALERDGDLWRMTEPIACEADQPACQELIWKFADLNAVRVAALAPKDLASFGLDKPELRLTVRTQADEAAKSEEKSIAVGAATDDGVYAMAAGGDRVFVIATDAAKVLRADFFSRQAMLFEADRAVVLQIIPAEGEAKRYEKLRGVWRMVQPRQEAAGQREMSAALADLSDCRADSVVARDAASSDLKKFGLDHPAMTIAVETEGGVKHELSLGAEEDGRLFARSSAAPFIYRIDKASIRGILDLAGR